MARENSRSETIQLKLGKGARIDCGISFAGCAGGRGLSDCCRLL